MPKANVKGLGGKQVEPVASTSSAEFTVRSFYTSSQAADALLSDAALTKKQHADKERKLNKEKNEKKWIALCGYIQVFPSLYDIECEDWKNTSLRKQRFADIMKQLNKEFNTEHTGRSTCIFFLVNKHPTSAPLL